MRQDYVASALSAFTAKYKQLSAVDLSQVAGILDALQAEITTNTTIDVNHRKYLERAFAELDKLLFKLQHDQPAIRSSISDLLSAIDEIQESNVASMQLLKAPITNSLKIILERGLNWRPLAMRVEIFKSTQCKQQIANLDALSGYLLLTGIGGLVAVFLVFRYGSVYFPNKRLYPQTRKS